MNIVKSRGLLREGTRWIVGNGHSIRFWEDNCMEGKLLVYKKFKRLMELLKEDMGRKVEDYIDQGRKWKKLYKDTYSQEDIQLLKELEVLLGAQRPPILIQEDTRVWDLTPIGNFTVKSAYKHLFSKVLCPPLWSKVWISNLLPKINFFWWTVQHGKILTLDNLKGRVFFLSLTDAISSKRRRRVSLTYSLNTSTP